MEIIPTKDLKQTPLFSEMVESELVKLSSMARIKRFPKRETIFREQIPADGFYVVRTGKVKLFKLSSDGKEQIIRLVGPGETFAEAAVFAGTSYPAYAETIADSELYFFPAKDFCALIEQNPRLAMKMLATLSNLLRRFALLVEELTLKEFSSRLAGYLLRQAELQGTVCDPKPRVNLDIGKAQLASRLGTVAETLSRTLKKFKESGWISLKGKQIFLIDADALKREAGK